MTCVSGAQGYISHEFLCKVKKIISQGKWYKKSGKEK